MIPSLFVSHGAPTLPLTTAPACTFLKSLGAKIETPTAILAISAHWETSAPTVNTVAVNDTIHDFYGFPEALYRLQYQAPGDPDLAARVTQRLAEAGFKTATDPRRGLDHGAWVPLMMMYPDATIPVVQLSIQSSLGPAHHLRLGQALAPLRAQGVLILASGGITHDLGRFRGQPVDAPVAPDVAAFADWVGAALVEGRTGDLLEYRRRAPHGAANHPHEDHFLPLFAALGAGGRAERLHVSATHGILRMDAFAFH
jgi:4,5-DOPA dioxygenase extradiol